MNMPRPHSDTSRLASTCALALLLSAPAALHADDYTWNLSTGGAWDATSDNWTGAGTKWVNGSGNNATFSIASGGSVSLGLNIVVGTLSTNGGGTVNFIGGAGTSIDVTNINTAGGGNVGAIDMTKVITGNHDLNYFGGGTGSSGRLNFKVANTYTGDTNLSGLAYVTLGSSDIAYLPTTTTLNMGSTATTLRFGANNQSQEIAGLTSSGTATNSAQIITTGVTGNTLKINTKSGVTTTFTGTVAGTLSLVVNGSGTQVLGGTTTNTFTGTTTVSGGTLGLAKLNALSATSSITVSGGTLTSSIANVNLGAGAVEMRSGAISARGIGAAGSFTLASNQNFTTTGGTLNFDLVSSVSFDQIIGTGTTGAFSLTDTTLSLSGLTSVAGTYQLFTGFGGANSVNNLTITGLANGFSGSLSNTGLLTVSAIPEPSAYAAIASITMLGFAGLRRRR